MKKKEISNEKLMFEIAQAASPPPPTPRPRPPPPPAQSSRDAVAMVIEVRAAFHAQENKKLSEPLTRALKEVEKLRHELANYQKDKMSLQNAKSRCPLAAHRPPAQRRVASRRLSKLERALAEYSAPVRAGCTCWRRSCATSRGSTRSSSSVSTTSRRSATSFLRSSRPPSTTCSRSRASRTSSSRRSCRRSTSPSRRKSRSSPRRAAPNCRPRGSLIRLPPPHPHTLPPAPPVASLPRSGQDALTAGVTARPQVIHAANLDPTMLGAVSKKLDDVLDAKNGAIKVRGRAERRASLARQRGGSCARSLTSWLPLVQDLHYELARITKAHNDVIRVYESKLTEFGIPVEELGFRPLVTSTGTGPAGLVVA